MWTYVAKRCAQALFVLVAVGTLTFSFMYLSGDPARLMLPQEATEAEVVAFRRQMGFDDPWLLQYARFMGRMLQGNLGRSLYFNEPVTSLLGERVGASLQLAGAALALVVVLAIPAGVAAAVHRGSMLDSLIVVGATLGQSMPVYWLGLLLIMLFAVQLGALPTGGRLGPASLVLPAVTLASFSLTRITRLTRTAALEVLGRDYIRTAWAKGLPARAVLFKHALRNAAIPIISLLGLEFGVMLGGAVITEVMFAWPGLGRLTVEAIFRRDAPVVQGVVMLSAFSFVAINLAVDLAYTVLNPRIAHAGTES
jgi:peptide/nickel transport system permease protein